MNGNIATLAQCAQAVGTVVAVWAAGRVVVLQQRLARTERVEALLGIAAYAVDQLTEAARVVRDAPADPWALLNARLGPMDDAAAMLAAVPAHELGSSQMVALFAQLRQLVREARPEFAKAQDMVTVAGDVSTYWEPLHSREQEGVEILAAIGRFHDLANGQRRSWWIR